MAGTEVPWGFFHVLGRLLVANRLGKWTPGAEVAPLGWMYRAGNLAFQRLYRVLFGIDRIGNRNRPEQGLRIRMLGLLVYLVPIGELDNLLRYMTATRSEICLTMDRSWAMNR